MLGAITGDTIGSAYEFCNTKDYNFTLFLSESAYTDDSVMTMAVAQWLLTDPGHTHKKLEEAMVGFAKDYPSPMGGYGTGFYRWLFFPKELFVFDDRYGPLPYKSASGRHPYGSWGNGSAMRVSAVGWFFDTLEETERVAKISAEITHNHPEGIKGAQATAAAIFLARTGKTKEEICAYIEQRRLGRQLPGNGAAGADMLPGLIRLRGCDPQGGLAGRRFRHARMHYRRHRGSILWQRTREDGFAGAGEGADGVQENSGSRQEVYGVWDEYGLEEALVHAGAFVAQQSVTRASAAGEGIVDVCRCIESVGGAPRDMV